MIPPFLRSHRPREPEPDDASAAEQRKLEHAVVRGPPSARDVAAIERAIESRKRSGRDKLFRKQWCKAARQQQNNGSTGSNTEVNAMRGYDE